MVYSDTEFRLDGNEIGEVVEQTEKDWRFVGCADVADLEMISRKDHLAGRKG